MSKGIYRAIPTKIWDSYDFYERMDTDEKYMYLYLLTNTQTNILGCYVLSPKKASIDTGFNVQQVQVILEKLEKLEKIYLDPVTKEIYIPEVQDSWTASNKYISGLRKQLDEVESDTFRDALDNAIARIDSSI